LVLTKWSARPKTAKEQVFERRIWQIPQSRLKITMSFVPALVNRCLRLVERNVVLECRS
jgi:hypothetical protein